LVECPPLNIHRRARETGTSLAINICDVLLRALGRTILGIGNLRYASYKEMRAAQLGYAIYALYEPGTRIE
jgi:hypothetical protein